MLIHDIIKAAIPDADESLCEYIAWGRTAFPFTPVSAKAFYKAASRFHRASHKGVRLCDFCDRVAEKNGLCLDCKKALNASH